MLTISNYVKAKTLEEAYELNQARSSRVMGGMMWMRLGNAKVKTVIDLSGLGLDQIEESDNVIKIGAMCTLRQIEECEALREMYGDGIAESVRHIVGVQFRNQATVGGSIYGRFGFSDVLTAFLALDTFVELYDGGTIRLSEFVNRKPGHAVLDHAVKFLPLFRIRSSDPVIGIDPCQLPFWILLDKLRIMRHLHLIAGCLLLTVRGYPV